MRGGGWCGGGGWRFHSFIESAGVEAGGFIESVEMEADPGRHEDLRVSELEL